MNASDYAAWWGAATGSLALVWEMFTYLRSGARIALTANPNMILYPETPLTKGKTFISVTAVNRGTAPTTITNLCGYHSASLRDRLRRRRRSFIITTGPPLSVSLPHVLQPGEQWSGIADQGSLLKDFTPTGYLFVGIFHNQSRRPIYRRVRFEKTKVQ